MKINFPRAITAWLSKGSPEVMEIAPETDNPAEPVALETENVATAEDNKASDSEIQATIDRLKAEHKAEMRKSRLAVFGDMAKAYLALNSDKIVPAEQEALEKGYVGAAMLDTESPIEGFSYLGSFQASISARKPHGAAEETIRGDAADVADKLNAAGLKVLPNAKATEEQIRAEKATDARIRAMLEATETGRAYLASKTK